MFLDSQSGILSAEDPNGTVTVDHSTFSGLGNDPTGNGAHGIYMGRYKSLRVTACRFERGQGGHYVKTRAPYVEILDSSFDDSHGHMSNYMIDLSNGAKGRIAGNEFVFGRDKDNHSTLITVAPEGPRTTHRGWWSRTTGLAWPRCRLQAGLRRQLVGRAAGDPGQYPGRDHADGAEVLNSKDRDGFTLCSRGTFAKLSLHHHGQGRDPVTGRL